MGNRIFYSILVVGIGFLFWGIWIALIMTRTEPIYRWLGIGSLPVFLELGFFLVRKIDKELFAKKFLHMSQWIAVPAGFVFWLLVLFIAYLFNVDVPYKINMTGGYLTMLIFLLLFRKREQN